MPQTKAVVLVVEDNFLVRMGAVEIVRFAGFEALEAGSADEAIAILEARPDIHLVFTDIEMPGTMDGIKLAHYIRGRWPPVKLMVASGKTIVDESALPEGSKFFRKPYSDNTIAAEMSRMLSNPSDRR